MQERVSISEEVKQKKKNCELENEIEIIWSQEKKDKRIKKNKESLQDL